MNTRTTFRLVTAAAIALVIPTAVRAQHDAAAMLKNQYVQDITSLESKFIELAGAMEPEMFSWRPMEGVRSVSEEFMLIAAENYVIPSVWGAEPPAGMTISNRLFESLPAEVTDREDVIDHLRRSFAYYKERVGALTAEQLHTEVQFFGRQRPVAEALFVISSDMHEHLGKSIANARMNQVVPPWTARAQQGRNND